MPSRCLMPSPRPVIIGRRRESPLVEIPSLIAAQRAKKTVKTLYLPCVLFLLSFPLCTNHW